MKVPHAPLAVIHMAWAAKPSGPVVHTHSGLAVFLEGHARFWMGTVWQIRPGDVLLVPEGMPHHRADRNFTALVGLSVCTPCLPTDRWGPPLRSLFERVQRGGCPVLRPEPDRVATIVNDLKELEAELATTTVGHELAVDGRMSLLTARLLRARPAEAVLPAAETPLVAQALAWITRHALEPISLVDVAQAVGRAPTHLAARVKKETGQPVGAWITDVRMAVARSRLLRGDENIGVLASQVGYASPSHFHRTFRRVHGLSPDRWRQLHRRPDR
ncbi:MAG: AraC family transcriptional regulator [Myxococcota bacterium]